VRVCGAWFLGATMSIVHTCKVFALVFCSNTQLHNNSERSSVDASFSGLTCLVTLSPSNNKQAIDDFRHYYGNDSIPLTGGKVNLTDLLPVGTRSALYAYLSHLFEG
jgi:hypothetical protein